MSEYKERLRAAKKGYIATDGPAEAGVRLLWCLEQVMHAYTNMDVENLRILFPSMKQMTVIGKDQAYVIGHITQLFILPTIIFEIATRIKVAKG
jgi:hypothetical protein|tara:strand:+ start:7593 stop:7874 length:282 start_codon:yes stop_codon:yes gene_type:complete